MSFDGLYCAGLPWFKKDQFSNLIVSQKEIIADRIASCTVGSRKRQEIDSLKINGLLQPVTGDLKSEVQHQWLRINES